MEDMICFLYKARKGKVRRRFANLVPLSLSKIWQNATIKKTLLHWIMTGCFQELIKVMCNKKVVRQANTNPFTIKSNVKLQCSSFMIVKFLFWVIRLYLKYLKSFYINIRLGLESFLLLCGKIIMVSNSNISSAKTSWKLQDSVPRDH